MDRQKTAWTREEEDLLRELRRRGRTWRQIAGALGRTEAACANHHSELLSGKIPLEGRGRFDPWRPEEDRILCEACLPGGPTLREVSERIGRSESACRKRAQQLGKLASRAPRSRPSQRRCHDCGKPTSDYRCPACRRKWQIKHGVPLDVAARNSSGDE